MAELDFEMKLDRMFNEPPTLPDPEAFARLVELRLDRGMNLRQIAMGVGGLVAGQIGVSPLINSPLLVNATQATERKAVAVTDGLNGLMRAGENLWALPFGGEAMWLAAGLGVMALAFAVTRAVEEFQ